MTPSEQARADAMADAETLLLFVAVYAEPRSALRKVSSFWRLALTVTECARGDDGRTDEMAEGVASIQGVCLARAAFRAVPGLRG